MFDAYTARKAAPRIVLAVIGINLSIYLCMAAIDITKVIGDGMGGLLTQPFIDANSYDFGVAGLTSGGGSGAVQAAGGAGAVYGILVSAGGLGALFGGVMTAGAAGPGILGTLLILAIPLMLTALAVMVTIVIRQALLVFLTIVSPVAMACYVLPGTEKYFKQWLDIFVKTLLVYPIVAVIFAMSDVFGSIVFRSAQAGTGVGGGAEGIVKLITGIIVIYAPLVLIPFAFRFAGGAMGKLASVAGAGAGKVASMGPIKGRREIAKRDLGNQMIQNRATAADRYKGIASKADTSTFRGRATKRYATKMQQGIAGYNIEAQSSGARAQTAKELNDQIATGRDEEIRALTVNKKWAHDKGKEGVDWRQQADGTKEYRTLGGAWVSEANVDAGHKRWGTDQYAQQTALSYEMRKAASDEEVERVRTNYANVAMASRADGGWGMEQGEAAGAMIGAGFENQSNHLEFKHMDESGSFRDSKKDASGNYIRDKDGNAVGGGESFVKELYEKKGSYHIANMSAHTVKQLARVYKDENTSDATREQIRGISETFVQRYGGGGTQMVTDDQGNQVPVPANPGQAGAQGNAAVSAQGSAHMNEAIYELVQMTGNTRPGGQPKNAYGDVRSQGNSNPGARQKD